MSSPITTAPNIAFEDCYWYTTMDLPGHGRVTGDWEIEDFAQYIGGVEITGRTVLDIGCASGFLMVVEKRLWRFGDLVRGRIHRTNCASAASMLNLFHLDHERWIDAWQPSLQRLKNSYAYCHKRLSSRNQVVYGDIFRLYRSIPKPIDISIAGAIMEHLNDQVSAIGSIARVTKHSIVIAFTPILDTDELVAKPIGPAPGQPAWTNPAEDYTWWMYCADCTGRSSRTSVSRLPGSSHPTRAPLRPDRSSSAAPSSRAGSDRKTVIRDHGPTHVAESAELVPSQVFEPTPPVLLASVLSPSVRLRPPCTRTRPRGG